MQTVDQHKGQKSVSCGEASVRSPRFEESLTDPRIKIVPRNPMPISKNPVTTAMPDGMGGLTVCLVTAVITNILESGLVASRMSELIGDVSVTALSPDRVSVSDDDRSRLNVFLYRVSPNLSIRKSSSTAATSVAIPSFVLDLTYLITSYGAQDFHAEILLGYVMQQMAQMSSISPEMLEAVIDVKGRSGNSVFASERIKQWTTEDSKAWDPVKVTPQFVNTEEMSRLWSALQARYRPSVVYQVSGVKIYGHPRQECL